MANLTDADIISTKRKALQDNLAATIREKAERPDNASAAQQDLDLAESILKLHIETDDSKANVRFFVHRGNNGNPLPTGLVDVELRLLHRLISSIEAPVMSRVFRVILDLGTSRRPIEGLGLLLTIRSKIWTHGFKLHLTARDTPLFALIKNPVFKLADVPLSVQLDGLVLDYDYTSNYNDLKSIVAYTETRGMPSIPVVDLRLRGFRNSLDPQISMAGLVGSFPQMASLHLDFNGAPATRNQPLQLLDQLQWRQLASLKHLKRLEIIARYKEHNLNSLPAFLSKSMPCLETLVLENVQPMRQFFSAVPQLTTLRIQHDPFGEKDAPKTFSTAIIDEVVAAIKDGRLKELETLCIAGPDVKTMGGSNIMRNVCKTIVDHYHQRCPKLQKLVFDFNYLLVDGLREATILQLLEDANDQFLAKAPLTIEFPRAMLDLPAEEHLIAPETYEDVIADAIGRLARAVHKSGLPCLRLSWTVAHYAQMDYNRSEYPIDRSKLDDILRRFKEKQRQHPQPLMQNLEIKELASDSVIADFQNNIETIRSIVWKNSNSGLMQRIVLTHRGPPEPQPAAGSGPVAGDGQGGEQPGAAAAGGNDQSEQ